ncbi:MAG: type II toxin-antitoxin system death-on-curing family toxin [Microthrixaceae bacterium]
MSVEYLDLADFLLIAEAVTGLDVKTLTKVSRLPLADSALHAPSAGFGDVDMYPDFVDKAAVLIVRLAMNHPLPDGNKRAAWVSMRMFVAQNGGSWRATPEIDDAERFVLAIASGELDEAVAAAWLRQHREVAPPDS